MGEKRRIFRCDHGAAQVRRDARDRHPDPMPSDRMSFRFRLRLAALDQGGYRGVARSQRADIGEGDEPHEQQCAERKEDEQQQHRKQAGATLLG